MTGTWWSAGRDGVAADGTKAAGLVKSAETKAIHEPRLFRGFKYVIESAGLPGFRINRKAVFGEFQMR
jgi:hypothetical protein